MFAAAIGIGNEQLGPGRPDPVHEHHVFGGYRNDNSKPQEQSWASHAGLLQPRGYFWKWLAGIIALARTRGRFSDCDWFLERPTDDIVDVLRCKRNIGKN